MGTVIDGPPPSVCESPSYMPHHSPLWWDVHYPTKLSLLAPTMSMAREIRDCSSSVCLTVCPSIRQSHFLVKSITPQRFKLWWQNLVQSCFWLSSQRSSKATHLDLLSTSPQPGGASRPPAVYLLLYTDYPHTTGEILKSPSNPSFYAHSAPILGNIFHPTRPSYHIVAVKASIVGHWRVWQALHYIYKLYTL